MMTNKNQHKRPFVEAAEDDGVPTMEIVDGVEEDLVLSESEYSSNENDDQGPQEEDDTVSKNSQQKAAQGLFESNLALTSHSKKMQRTNSQKMSTAASYVWIRERRTTFTGLTFEQR